MRTGISVNIKEKIKILFLIVIISTVTAVAGYSYAKHEINVALRGKTLKELNNYRYVVGDIENEYKCDVIENKNMFIKDEWMVFNPCQKDNRRNHGGKTMLYDLKKKWDEELQTRETEALRRAKVIYKIKESELQ